MIAEIIAQNIEKIRLEHKLTQEEASQILGQSRATYNAIENTKRPVTIDELEKLANHYGVSIDYFFGRPRQVLRFEQMYLYALQHFKAGIPKTKLAKLLYLADFSKFYDQLEPMSGVNYIKRQYGPVADIFFETTDHFYDEGVIDIIPDEFTLRIIPLLSQTTYDLLSAEDLKRIDNICSIWQNKRTAEIVNFTHHQKPWMACRDGEVIPYSLIVQEEPNNVYSPVS